MATHNDSHQSLEAWGEMIKMILAGNILEAV